MVPIEGTITFTPDGNGQYNFEADLENFPNYEAYYWEDGEFQQTIFQIQNFLPNEQSGHTASLDTGLRMVGNNRTHYETQWQRNTHFRKRIRNPRFYTPLPEPEDVVYELAP
jgi:hypothetical protein